MRRRSIVLLAGGVLALAMAPPVFGAGDSTTPPPGQSAASTTTTAPASGAATTSTTATTAPSSTATTATTAPAGTGSTTTTTAATDGQAPAPSGNCAAPVQTHEPAPAEGQSAVYPAGDAGEVEVSRTSATELEIVNATANDGWTAEVTAPTGPRVKARFVEDATSSKTRFAASMDQHGDEIHIRVEDCS